MVPDPLPATSDPLPLFRHTSFFPLLRLLHPHLPQALPLYSTLQTPGVEFSVWASFPLTDEDVEASFLPPEKPCFVLADLGNQLRFFCSAELERDLTMEEKEKAEDLIVRSFRWYLRHHPQGRADIRIGAIPDVWTSCTERAFSKPFYPSNIHYQLLPPLSPASPASSSSSSITFPDGIFVAAAEEKHIKEILSTSDVPHLPSYILTRLPYSTALFHSPTPPASPGSSSPTTSSSSSSAAQAPITATSPPPELVAHCITHRDGSIGTVYVSPSFRQRGIGSLLLQERMREMASGPSPSPPPAEEEGLERYGYCYVSPGNEKSRALMRRVGMRMTEWCVSWAIVQLPFVK